MHQSPFWRSHVGEGGELVADGVVEVEFGAFIGEAEGDGGFIVGVGLEDPGVGVSDGDGLHGDVGVGVGH